MTDRPAGVISFEDAAKRVLAKLFGIHNRSPLAETTWAAATLDRDESFETGATVVERLGEARGSATKALVMSRHPSVLVEEAIAALDHALYVVTSELKTGNRDT